MTKQTAVQLKQAELRAVTEGFESEPVVASNDPGPAQTSNKVEELRERIRSARLETMMARKLENELSIDPLTLQPTIEPLAAAPAAPALPSSYEPSTLNQETRSADSWTKSRFRSNRQECETLVHDFAEQANSIIKLADRSNTLLDYLDRVEQDLETNRSAELELREKSRDLERSEKQRVEHIALIEKQSRQIEMLETMRQTSSDKYEAAKRELDTLQLECDRKESKYSEVIALVSRLERENVALNERSETMHRDLESSTDAMTALREKSHEQDRQLSRVRTEFDAVSIERERALEELATLQVRHNELNKKSLEHQGHHYARINELEDTVRELRGKLELVMRERDDNAKELEAANNLLMLHEEMITTLSSERD